MTLPAHPHPPPPPKVSRFLQIPVRVFGLLLEICDICLHFAAVALDFSECVEIVRLLQIRLDFYGFRDVSPRLSTRLWMSILFSGLL